MDSPHDPLLPSRPPSLAWERQHGIVDDDPGAGLLHRRHEVSQDPDGRVVRVVDEDEPEEVDVCIGDGLWRGEEVVRLEGDSLLEVGRKGRGALGDDVGPVLHDEA